MEEYDVGMEESDREIESDSESFEGEWKQIEDDIHHLSALQIEAYDRMMALTHLLSSLESNKPDEAVLSAIRQCHQESLQELEETGEVTFGQRLLATLGSH